MSNLKGNDFVAPVDNESNVDKDSEAEIEVQLFGGKTANRDISETEIPELEDTVEFVREKIEIENERIGCEDQSQERTRSAESEGRLQERNAYLEAQWQQCRDIENLKFERTIFEEKLKQYHLKARQEKEARAVCESQLEHLKAEKDLIEGDYRNKIENLTEKIQELEQRPISTSTTRFTAPRMQSCQFENEKHGDYSYKNENERFKVTGQNATSLNQVFLGPAMDSLLTPKTFSGNEDCLEWLESFTTFTTFKGLDDNQIANLLPFCLSGAAKYWYQGLPETTKMFKMELINAFKQHFAPTQSATWKQQAELWERKMRPSESVRDYIANMRKLATKISADEATTMGAIVKGLRASLRTIIIPLNPNSLAELEEVAKRAEDALSNENNSADDVLNAIKEMNKKLEAVAISQTTAQNERKQEKNDIAVAVVRQNLETPKINRPSGRFPNQNFNNNNNNRFQNQNWNNRRNNWNPNNRPNTFGNSQYNPRPRTPFQQQWRWSSPSQNNENRGNFYSPNFQRPRNFSAPKYCYICYSPNHLAKQCDQVGRNIDQRQNQGQQFPRYQQNTTYYNPQQ